MKRFAHACLRSPWFLPLVSFAISHFSQIGAAHWTNRRATQREKKKEVLHLQRPRVDSNHRVLCNPENHYSSSWWDWVAYSTRTSMSIYFRRDTYPGPSQQAVSNFLYVFVQLAPACLTNRGSFGKALEGKAYSSTQPTAWSVPKK
jgi:hypothetical protein